MFLFDMFKSLLNDLCYRWKAEILNASYTDSLVFIVLKFDDKRYKLTLTDMEEE